MTYDVFEQIGMQAGAPFGVCKVLWTFLGPELQAAIHEDTVRMMWAKHLKAFPPEVLEQIQQWDTGCLDSSAYERMGQFMLQLDQSLNGR